jgi:hypothetical protein
MPLTEFLVCPFLRVGDKWVSAPTILDNKIYKMRLTIVEADHASPGYTLKTELYEVEEDNNEKPVEEKPTDIKELDTLSAFLKVDGLSLLQRGEIPNRPEAP